MRQCGWFASLCNRSVRQCDSKKIEWSLGDTVQSEYVGGYLDYVISGLSVELKAQ